MEHPQMTHEELARYTGRDGSKAYVAVSGKVYDVTESPRWQNGSHEGAHQAGADLTLELKAAPHVRSVIERFPVVGTLVEAPLPTPEKKGSMTLWVVIAVVIIAVGWFVFGR